VLVFDTPVARQELPGEERFGRVRLARDTLVLLPGPRVAAGEVWPLTVYFADGAAPASAELRLVVQAALADRQVEVYRHPRDAETLQAELAERDGQIQQCQTELARLWAVQAPLNTLSGWMEARLMMLDGVRSARQAPAQHPRNALLVIEAHVLKAVTLAAVHLELLLPGGQPWQAGNATLQGQAGPSLRVLRVWQPSPLTPGQAGVLVVDVEVPKALPPGPYTLLVEEAGGPRAVTLKNLVFP
jgi:uncharacterized protein (TIGR02268 family)